MIEKIVNALLGFVVITTLFAFAYFLNQNENKSREIAELSKKNNYLQTIVFKSEYYTKISTMIWGKEARRCDTGLIIKIENYIKEIDSTLTVDDILALIVVESGFNTFAVSNANARGLMQILPSTARWLDSTVNENDLFNEDVNLRLGIKYLSMLKRKLDNNIELALIAYNRGPKLLEIEIKNNEVNRNYSNAVKKLKLNVR